jgi:hypothetical protein
MPSNPPQNPPDQAFSDDEQLFRRVRRENFSMKGKPTLLGFTLPDMSVNREKYGSAPDALRGFNSADWGVAAFLTKDIPPRIEWKHVLQIYELKPRHVPEHGNYSHGEVRVWRMVEQDTVLITERLADDFDDCDLDRNEKRDSSEKLLDPDFHMRWRKHIALASKTVLPPEKNEALS